jgi:lipid-A-disaccharide synthase
MIVAGEPSGEKHAAKLVSELKKTNQQFEFFGMGGRLMKEEGVELIEDIKNMAVMGIFEIITKLPFLYKTLFRLTKTLKTKKPDILILVDFQAFNLKLAKKAKKLGIKTLFYIGPQVWAWRSYRVKKMRKVIDNMAVIFPFEVDFYKKHNLTATYVGHPLAGLNLPADSDKQAKVDFLAKYNISEHKKIVTFLPGSRSSEIANHLPIYQQVLESLEKNTQVQCLVSRYDKNKHPELFKKLPKSAIIIDNDLTQMVKVADFAVVASGTATLETALLNTPMCVMARVSKLSYFIYSRLVKLKYIAMVNIIADKFCVKEFIQENATSENILNEINHCLDNKEILEEMRQCFETVRQKLNNKPEGTLVDLSLRILNE